MFAYDLQLALRNLRRNPGLTALMIGAVALGIAVCVMTLTLYRAMSGQPDLVEERRALRRDDGLLGPGRSRLRTTKPDLPPQQLTYRDAMAVYDSDIPKRKVIMHKAVGIVSVGRAGA